MQLIRRFWRDYARRYKGWYLLGIACLVATNALTVAIPSLVRAAVDALERGEGTGGALPFAAAVLLAGIAIIFVRTLSRTLFFNPGRTVEYRMKAHLFERLTRLPRAWFDRMTAGDIINRGTNDANGMRALIGFGALQLFNVVFTLLLTVGMMLYTEPMLTLWCVGPLALAVLVLRKAVNAMFRYQGQMLAQLSVLSQRVLESYGGVGVLQAFDAVPGAQSRFDTDNERLLFLGVKLLHVRTWLLPVVGVTGNLCVAAVLYVGGTRVVHDADLTLGALAAFIVYINILVSGLTSMGWLVGAVQHGYLSLGRMYAVIDAKADHDGATAPMPLAPPEGHHLKVSNLTFQHPTAKTPALSEVSFEVAPGEILGIFGLTGAGKSALLDVLARVYDPPEGTVTLDGADIVDIEPQAYRAEVCLVGQRPFLFSASIAANIALGADKPDADRIAAAVRDAALEPDVGSFPAGLLTEVGERGITVSGGQRQRIALARAFYRDFKVLLLDDVMSAVDHATEHVLVEALYRRARGRTTIAVSHRVSVLERADRVLVLDEGRVVDLGTHAELVTRDGPYQKAWSLQRAAERFAAEVGDDAPNPALSRPGNPAMEEGVTDGR